VLQLVCCDGCEVEPIIGEVAVGVLVDELLEDGDRALPVLAIRAAMMARARTARTTVD